MVHVLVLFQEPYFVIDLHQFIAKLAATANGSERNPDKAFERWHVPSVSEVKVFVPVPRLLAELEGVH